MFPLFSRLLLSLKCPRWISQLSVLRTSEKPSFSEASRIPLWSSRRIVITARPTLIWTEERILVIVDYSPDFKCGTRTKQSPTTIPILRLSSSCTYNDCGWFEAWTRIRWRTRWLVLPVFPFRRSSLPVSLVLHFFLVCECRCEPSCEDCHQTVWNSPCHCQERCQWWCV